MNEVGCNHGPTKIIAIKPLAAGRLSAEEGLSYLSHKVDGVAVGITSKKEAEETFRTG